MTSLAHALLEAPRKFDPHTTKVFKRASPAKKYLLTAEKRWHGETWSGDNVTCFNIGPVSIEAYPKWADQDVVNLRSVIVPPSHRGKGAATEALRQLTQLADQLGITLDLRACPIRDAPMSAEQLVAFYRKFGFVSRADTAPTLGDPWMDTSMTRLPQRGAS